MCRDPSPLASSSRKRQRTDDKGAESEGDSLRTPRSMLKYQRKSHRMKGLASQRVAGAGARGKTSRSLAAAFKAGSVCSHVKIPGTSSRPFKKTKATIMQAASTARMRDKFQQANVEQEQTLKQVRGSADAPAMMLESRRAKVPPAVTNIIESYISDLEECTFQGLVAGLPCCRIDSPQWIAGKGLYMEQEIEAGTCICIIGHGAKFAKDSKPFRLGNAIQLHNGKYQTWTKFMKMKPGFEGGYANEGWFRQPANAVMYELMLKTADGRHTVSATALFAIQKLTKHQEVLNDYGDDPESLWPRRYNCTQESE